MGDNVTRTSDRFGGYGSELTADQLAAIQGANDPSATNVFITEDDLSDLPDGSDEKVKYNADDPTAGYLADKIIAGTNVTIEEGTGADENKLKISATIGSTTDELVKYNAGDPTGGYLADKVINGDGITISEGVGADENKVVVSNSDKGSTAVGSHELAYDHTKIKDYVEAVTSTNDDQFPISYLSYTKGSVSYDVTEIPKPNGLIYGGGVSWVELLKFDVSAAAYYLDGVLYTTDSAQVTLDPADGLLPRIDIIIVDTSETVSIITGVPNANPQKPTVDPITQIELTNILVPEGATEPGITITQEIIYNENTEWVGSSSGVTVDFTNAAQPYDKTVATLVGTLTNNDTVTYTKSTTSVAHENFENLIFNIRLNATVANQHNLYVRWLEDGVSVSNEVRVPLNKSNITSYQNINMSLSLWTWNQNNVDAVRFRWSRSGGAASHVGFYLDLLKLEKGITVISGSSGIELTGDVTGSGVTGSPVNTTLATVNSNIGTFGDASNIPQVTVDGKGRITSISQVAVTIPPAITPTSDITPVDTDEVVSLRGANWLKTTWTVLKAFLKTYFDGIYSAIGHTHTFISLTDTPANYTGAGGKTVKVNAGATGLEFVDGGGTTAMSYTLDFQASAVVMNDINLEGAITITDIIGLNVASLKLDNVTQALGSGLSISVSNQQILAWEITRTAPGYAALGIKFTIT